MSPIFPTKLVDLASERRGNQWLPEGVSGGGSDGRSIGGGFRGTGSGSVCGMGQIRDGAGTEGLVISVRIRVY